MIKVFNIEDNVRWDALVDSFPKVSSYYLSGYVKAFQLIRDGEPMLIHFKDESNEAVCVMMKRDVAEDPRFVNLEHNKYFDLITPYGYGGFFFKNDDVSDYTLYNLNKELKIYLNENDIISLFFRFHPILDNSKYHREIASVIDLGKTIAFDLSTPEIIWQNIISKSRNHIRKAEKSGVEIKHGTGMGLLSVFKEIYDETMRHDNAEEYYFFPIEFYESIDRDLHDNYEVFYAEYDGKIIAMSIMLFVGNQMDYHLSGSIYEYRNLAPSNLLLYKAALWGSERGFKTFHLGGGVGSGEDNLYKFKAAFNRNSDYQFSIGKLIVNDAKYDELLKLRGFSEEDKDSIRFFPQYRGEIKK